MQTPNVEWSITLPDNITVRQALSIMATFNLTAEHDSESLLVVFHPRNAQNRCPTRAEVNKAMRQSPPDGLSLRHVR